MEYLHEIFGIKFNQMKNFEDKFEEVIDLGEEKVYVSKETFSSEDDDFNFEFKYVIDVVFCEGQTFYSLELMVLPKYICKELKEKILSSCGLEENEEPTIFDCLSYGGCSVTFGSTRNEEEREEVDVNVLNKIASVFESMNRLRGFYLDKAVNALGTSGWDILEYCINNKPWF